MACRKIIEVSLILLLSIYPCVAQNDFTEWQIVQETEDSIYRVKWSDIYYDYFLERDAAHAVVDFSEARYKQVYSVDKETNSGYFRIYFKDTLVFNYNVKENAITGLGSRYDFITCSPVFIGYFQKSRLNGTLLYFDKVGQLEFVAKYRYGRFKGYLFHISARFVDDLRKLSKSSGDPIK